MIWMPNPAPYVGERRVVRRFAWLPVTLVNGARLWLESYYALEAWTREFRYDIEGGYELQAWRTVSRTTFDPTSIVAQPVTEAVQP